MQSLCFSKQFYEIYDYVFSKNVLYELSYKYSKLVSEWENLRKNYPVSFEYLSR